MDPLSGLAIGASILPFVQVGLKSVKGLCKTLSQVHDAPDRVRQAERDVNGLIATLEKLSISPALSHDDSESLKTCLRACAEDVERLEAELKKYIPGDNERRRKKYWKATKATLSDDKIAGISNVVAGHTSALNLLLQTIQSDVAFGITSQLSTISTVGAQHMALSTEQTSTLNSMSASITELREEQAAVLKSIDALPSALTERYDSFQQLFKEFLEKATGLSQQDGQPRRVVEVDTPTTDDPPPMATQAPRNEEPCEKLVSAIAALCEMSQQMEELANADEDSGILQRISAVLGIMMSPEFMDAVSESGMLNSGLCRCCHRGWHARDLKKGVELVYGSILLNQQVAIEQPNNTGSIANRKRKRSTWTSGMFDLGSCLLTFASAQTSQVVSVASSSASTTHASGQPGNNKPETITTMTLIPKNSMLQKSVRISSSQSRRPNGVYSSIPRLSFHRILAATSPVFTLIEHGQLEEFKALVISGEVRLTDQDEYGATFLHYASHYTHPEICRYLIQAGADVDYLAPFIRGQDLRVLGTPLMMRQCNDHQASTEEISRIVACRKAMLDAGGDPSIESAYSWEENGHPRVVHDYLARHIMREGVSEIIRVLLDFGTYFTNVNELFQGWPPLFHLCDGGLWSMQSIAVLVSRGADVKFRDEDGRTCLHLCLGVTQSTYIAPLRPQRDGLVYLIQTGANVDAVDNRGRSVFDYAYTCWREDFGSKAVDLWVAALVASGNLPEGFQQESPMRVEFAKYYTRRDFDEIWKGLEHLRPHYDVVESCSETDSGDGDHSSHYSDEDFEDEEETDGMSTEDDSDSDAGGVPVVDPTGSEQDRHPSSSVQYMVPGPGDEDDGSSADDEGSENGVEGD